MPIDDAIYAYESISSKAFSGSTWFGTQQSRAERLEDALKEIVRLRTSNEETRMLNKSKCKV